MTASVKATAAAGREEFAERLLKGSVKKSYAPDRRHRLGRAAGSRQVLPASQDRVAVRHADVGRHDLARNRSSLSRQELVNTLSAGIWFENILNQALLRKMMHQDPTASATHYALTELGDETRHMVMFGKAIERVGAKPVRPRLYQRMIINALPLAFQGSVLWMAALIGEEIFDSLQRQMMDDPELQPMVQRLMRIHVTEEARHIQFARDGLRKRDPAHAAVNRSCGWPTSTASAGTSSGSCSPTRCRTAASVWIREARRAARRSPHRHEVQIGVRTAGRVSRRGRVDGPDRPPDVEAQPLPVSDIYDVAFLDAERIAGLNPSFDESTHTWTLQGEQSRARVLIATDGAVPDGTDRDGLGLAPYLGVAVHGVPNYFLITGPDVAAQKSYIAKCLRVMADTHATRIEVRHSTQRYFAEHERSGQIRCGASPTHPTRLRHQLGYRRRGRCVRRRRHRPRRRRELPAHVRLTGHLDPIDGHYHWQGTVFGQLPDDKLPQPVIVTVGEPLAPTGRITERTSQGGYSVAGVGAPPFALDAVEVAFPVR